MYACAYDIIIVFVEFVLLQVLDGVPAWIIGEVVEGDRSAEINPSPQIIEVENLTLPPFSSKSQ